MFNSLSEDGFTVQISRVDPKRKLLFIRSAFSVEFSYIEWVLPLREVKNWKKLCNHPWAYTFYRFNPFTNELHRIKPNISYKLFKRSKNIDWHFHQSEEGLWTPYSLYL